MEFISDGPSTVIDTFCIRMSQFIGFEVSFASHIKVEYEPRHVVSLLGFFTNADKAVHMTRYVHF